MENQQALEEDLLVPASAAVFAVMMLVENQGGNVYTAQDILGWLAAAGFDGLAVQRLPEPSPMAVISGTR